jgi:hypothetical protein
VNQHSILVATPAYGNTVTVSYLISVTNLLTAAAKRKLLIQIDAYGNDSLITRARNTLVAKFLDLQQHTHLLFIDADIGFNPELVFRMLDFDKDVVGAAYPYKSIDWNQVQHNARNFTDKILERSLRYSLNVADPKHVPSENGFVKVLDIGTGFLLIKRSVFEKIALANPELEYKPEDISFKAQSEKPKFWAFFDCSIEPDTRRYLSEDYTFCRRWQKLGGDIWCDITYPLSHTGSYIFEGDISTLVASQ